jgi:hypothetical protein
VKWNGNDHEQNKKKKKKKKKKGQYGNFQKGHGN